VGAGRAIATPPAAPGGRPAGADPRWRPGRDVFIVHDADDKDLCLYLAAAWGGAVAGALTFWSSWDVDKGHTWSSELRDRVRGALAVVVLLNPFSLENRWVNTELGAAWVLGKPIFPCTHLGAQAAMLTGPVANHQVTDLQSSADILRLLESLCRLGDCGLVPDFSPEALSRRVRRLDKRQIEPFRSLREIGRTTELDGATDPLAFADFSTISKSDRIFVEKADAHTLRISADAYPETHVVFLSQRPFHDPRYLIVEVLGWQDLESREKLKFFGVDLHGHALWPRGNRQRRMRNRDHGIYTNCGRGFFPFEIPGYLYAAERRGKLDFGFNFWMLRVEGLLMRVHLSRCGYGDAAAGG
jgi:hypothetical protein